MAAFAASFARGQTRTDTDVDSRARPAGPAHARPRPVAGAVRRHRPGDGGMHHQRIGPRLQLPALRIPNLRVAGKTGTAQAPTPEGQINLAWFIAFARWSGRKSRIAVMLEGDTPGEETGGGRYAAPVAHAIIKAWWEKEQKRRLALPATSRPLANGRRRWQSPPNGSGPISERLSGVPHPMRCALRPPGARPPPAPAVRPPCRLHPAQELKRPIAGPGQVLVLIIRIQHHLLRRP
jgi:hypothetical protein